MAWDDTLLENQKIAAAHIGTHARLLAGPGTGKTLTLTRRICFLITEKNIKPEKILALTFTRAATRELSQRVEKQLGKNQSPRISTLHSFALRQLFKNANKIESLPQPLRIADDWEEEEIILPDIKSLLGLRLKKDAKDFLNCLSADWQSLTADKQDWEKSFPNPRFLGVWREHRQIYGYTLRSELVYQLKKALEQRGDFNIENSIEYLLVDEYQDLNRCDLAVIKEISDQGVELFVAGDDDQSIYGFRKAHPEGIRKFPEHYSNTTKLELEICKRCDKGILGLGLFVANQDNKRIKKRIVPEEGRAKGEVKILRFDNQDTEAKGITNLCKYLIKKHKTKPNDILILLRTDHNNVFSELIQKKLERADIPVATTIDTKKLFDEKDGRAFLALLRLAINKNDSLAWRTLLQVWCHGIGEKAINAVYEFANENGKNFAETIFDIHSGNSHLPKKYRNPLTRAISNILKEKEKSFPEDSLEKEKTQDELMGIIRPATKIIDEENRDSILSKIEKIIQTSELNSIEKLLGAIEAESQDIEQEIEEDKINILTMHRAKGLTAKAVIIAATEDEYIPGKAKGEQIGDERRLLYVSLTRAKHHLFITHCDQRTGQQTHTGRNSGNIYRSLSQFLADCPYKSQDGKRFTNDLPK